MDWLNDLPTVTGIDKVVAEMAKRLIEGPLVFRCPFWEGDIVIETLDDYRAWARFASRMDHELGAEEQAFLIWERERSRGFVAVGTILQQSVRVRE